MLAATCFDDRNSRPKKILHQKKLCNSSALAHLALLQRQPLIPPIKITASVLLTPNLLGLLLLLVHNRQPIVRHSALSLLALIPVLGLPVLRGVVVLQFPVPSLGLDALLLRELLPLGLLLVFGHGLLARQVRGGSGQVELQGLVFGRFRDGAGCQELVDQALCGVARDGLKGRFFVFGERGERVGIVAEEGAEVEGEGLGFGLEVRHFCVLL